MAAAQLQTILANSLRIMDKEYLELVEVCTRLCGNQEYPWIKKHTQTIENFYMQLAVLSREEMLLKISVFINYSRIAAKKLVQTFQQVQSIVLRIYDLHNTVQKDAVDFTEYCKKNPLLTDVGNRFSAIRFPFEAMLNGDTLAKICTELGEILSVVNV